ncbi:MAG: hypothetical protein DMG34_10690 [Acidobacteria bacterium]|nr:MAG: hypothetical protein DMG34_10690 [Acidobacteriota bacterium]
MGTKFLALFRCFRAKRLLSIVCGSLLLSAATVAALIGGGVDDPNGVFQLEGNAVTDGSPFSANTDDWDKALGIVAGGHSIANTGVVADLTNTTADNEFTGGSSKDIYDVSKWQWNTSKPQGKDDIAHAYAAAYTLANGHTAIYFGLDRYDGSGDATAGFWFFQDGTVSLNNVKSGGADGGFNGTHKAGDFLIVSDFSTGGAVSTIEVFQWVGGDGAAGHLTNVTPLISTNATCDITTGNATLCAITNSTTQVAPWAFKDKSGSSSFLKGEFLEGGIDLNAIFGADVPCVTTFMAETRASNSATSTLSDFSPPHSFPLCGIAVTKSCPQGAINAAGTGFTYGYNGTVTNTGIGTVTNVVVTDNLPANATNKNPDPPTFTFASLAPHQCVRWPGGGDCNSPATQFAHFDSTTNGPLNSAHAVADTPSGVPVTADSDDDPNTAGNQPAMCPTVEITPMLTVTKSCGPTCLVSGGSGDVVKVNFTGQVCNSSTNVPLTNVTVTDVPAGTFVSGSNMIVSTTVGFTIGGSLAPNTCANLAGSYIPTSPLDANLGFEDHLHATATSPLGGTPPSQDSGQKDCPVCPLGNCAP